MPTIPATMMAVEITEPGGPEVLRLTERPTPAPAKREVLIKVAAAGVNRPDVSQRQGAYPPPPGASDIPGLEVAGEIVALGAGVEGWRQGDTACALVTGGGYAEYCPAPAAQLLPYPKGYDAVQAAALPETFYTVWHNVFDRARLKAGETILVHGGSSGIGTTAIQLAKAFGATVLTTAGSEAKCAACLKLGASRAINYKTEDFAEAVKAEAEGGVDVILDMIGGAYLERNLASLALEGRLALIALLGGRTAEINLGLMLMKRLTISGSVLRSRPVAEKAAIAERLLGKVWPLLDKGEVAPVIDQTFALGDAAEAHARMETSAHIGKIMLTVGG